MSFQRSRSSGTPRTSSRPTCPRCWRTCEPPSPTPRRTTRGYQEAAASFLDLCRKTIGPAVSPADVREMLLQHILTKDIFLSIFKEDQFHQENNVARQLDTLGANLLHR